MTPWHLRIIFFFKRLTSGVNNHSHWPVTSLARCQNVILSCQDKGRELFWSLPPIVLPSSHSWAVRDGSGLPSAVQVFCRPSVTSWLPRAVASSGHCHQHHSCLGTACVPALSPHHVWDAGRASASHCLMGTQLFSSFTTIIAVLCCLSPRCGLFALMVH